MKIDARPSQRPFTFFKSAFGAATLFVGLTTASASDFSDQEVEWEFKSGLDRSGFAESFSRLTKDNFRIVDIETYRSGRNTTVSTVWTKINEGDAWQIETSKPIKAFIEAHTKHLENGYSLVEFEVDRFGATLHFSGVWLKTKEGLDAEFYFGMESLDFSNRYGEMADRGYRLIDFEAYEANGKYRHAGVWLKNDTGREVRFYRAIEKNRFGEVAALMENGGFRLLDIEGYQYEGKFVFAGEWVKNEEWQESKYAFDLLPDEFYNKNSAYVNDGYRLTEFETYQDNDTVYYAGSWLKGTPVGFVPEKKEPEAKKKSLSLEAFRSGED